MTDPQLNMTRVVTTAGTTQVMISSALKHESRVLAALMHTSITPNKNIINSDQYLEPMALVYPTRKETYLQTRPLYIHSAPKQPIANEMLMIELLLCRLNKCICVHEDYFVKTEGTFQEIFTCYAIPESDYDAYLFPNLSGYCFKLSTPLSPFLSTIIQLLNGVVNDDAFDFEIGGNDPTKYQSWVAGYSEIKESKFYSSGHYSLESAQSKKRVRSTSRGLVALNLCVQRISAESFVSALFHGGSECPKMIPSPWKKNWRIDDLRRHPKNWIELVRHKITQNVENLEFESLETPYREFIEQSAFKGMGIWSKQSRYHLKGLRPLPAYGFFKFHFVTCNNEDSMESDLGYLLSEAVGSRKDDITSLYMDYIYEIPEQRECLIEYEKIGTPMMVSYRNLLNPNPKLLLEWCCGAWSHLYVCPREDLEFVFVPLGYLIPIMIRHVSYQSHDPIPRRILLVCKQIIITLMKKLSPLKVIVTFGAYFAYNVCTLLFSDVLNDLDHINALKSEFHLPTFEKWTEEFHRQIGDCFNTEFQRISRAIVEKYKVKDYSYNTTEFNMKQASPELVRALGRDSLRYSDTYMEFLTFLIAHVRLLTALFNGELDNPPEIEEFVAQQDKFYRNNCYSVDDMECYLSFLLWRLTFMCITVLGWRNYSLTHKEVTKKTVQDVNLICQQLKIKKCLYNVDMFLHFKLMLLYYFPENYE